MTSTPLKKVIVVGAGPSGLLLALLLAKKNISVQLVDAAVKLDEQPRATHYAPPAVYELKRAGVLDDVNEQGFIPNGVCWRKLDGTYISGLDAKNIPEDYPYKLVCLPLNRLGRILLDHVTAQPTAEVSWGCKVVNIGQDEQSAWVDVTGPNGEERLKADFVVGCDGANSQVRRSLFGDWEFPGFTWDEQIVATNTYYDFDQFGWEDANFIIHPEHWYMAARIGKGKGKDSLWRVSYGEKPRLTPQELLDRQEGKFEAMLPGNPKPDQYKVVNISPYKIHQRLAEKMRVGRILLAADAAHLCNPFGGLGLTGGIADIGSLYDCLAGIYEGVADLDILDKYDSVRRNIYNTVINPISSENVKRLHSQDPEKVLENDQFLMLLAKTEKDPELSRNVQLGIMDILRHDFTQYYKKPTNVLAGVS